jgi:predicted ABC-type ATPase
LGVERFEDGDDPGQPANAGPSKDAGRSGEAPSSSDIGRAGDQTPDSSPRESLEAHADKQAEPRTRDEYADHLAPGSSPVGEDSPKPETEQPSHPGDEFRAAARPRHDHAENSHFAEEPDEQHAVEEQAHSNDPAASGEKQGSLSAPAVEAVQPDNEGTEPPDKHKAPHHDAETNSGLDTDTESDDDLGHEPDDQSEPPDVDEVEGIPSDVRRTTETNEGGNLEPALTPSPEPNEENPAEGLPAPDGSDQDTLEINERTRPLTDREWAEHLTEVRDGLDWARRHGLQTHRLYTIDSDKREWSAERNRLQGEIVREMYEHAKDVPCDQQAIIAGGLGGAGKTTILTEYANIDLSNYLVVNPDDIKEQMARRGMIPEISGLSPMEASDLAHEESSYIAKRLAMRAAAEGKNLIWDITMSSEDSTKERINNLRSSGYNHIEGLFVDISIETSVRRIDARHREGHDMYRAGLGLGGRFVPEEVSRDQEDPEWGSQNRRTFERVKRSLDTWSVYDNSLDGRSPIRIESNSN